MKSPIPITTEFLRETCGNFLNDVWPRVSGINEPCIVEEGSIEQHAVYLRCLPLFKESPKQKSWGWWATGEYAREPQNQEYIFRLCDRCRKYYEAPKPVHTVSALPRSQVREDELAELLGLDPDSFTWRSGMRVVGLGCSHGEHAHLVGLSIQGR